MLFSSSWLIFLWLVEGAQPVVLWGMDITIEQYTFGFCDLDLLSALPRGLCTVCLLLADFPRSL